METNFIFSDLTVLDKITGLVWTRNANISGKGLQWDKAHHFINELNAQRYAGHSDWRLPSQRELETFTAYAVDRGYRGYYGVGGSLAEDCTRYFIKIGFIINCSPSFWSSTTRDNLSGYAWAIDMEKFSGTYRDCDTYRSVWPVRFGQ